MRQYRNEMRSIQKIKNEEEERERRVEKRWNVFMNAIADICGVEYGGEGKEEYH